MTSPFAQNFYSRTIGATGTYTLFNGFQTANRTRQAESQVDARARDAARHRAAGAARCRDRLHEFAARSGGARFAAAQRRGSDRATQADPRPFQCRRSDAHRRGASRIAARRRTLATSRRPVAIRDIASQLSPGDRRRSGQPRAGHAGRPAVAQRRWQRRSRKARRRARRFLPPPMASMLPSLPSRSAKARSIRTSR